MAFQSTVCVWAGLRQKARCKRCRQPIVWLTRMDTGKSLPFAPGFTVLNHGRDHREAAFQRVSFTDVHRCAAKKRPTARRRAAAQGRLL
jgi:hypothetical protein